VTSLLPLVLMPFAGIMSSKAVSASYWGWVHMLFVGAFIVDIAIEQVNLHRRVALAFLMKVGVGYPAITALAFGTVSYCLSMWCSNVATTVMLTPFACGLLDTMLRAGAGDGKSETPEKLEMHRRYSTGVLLTIAYTATAGGIATLIGTPPNGVLAGISQVNNAVNAVDWMLFALPISFITALLAFASVYFIYLRGMRVEMDLDVLRVEYKALGPLNRDEAVVASVLLLQILGWLTRKDLINVALGIKGVGDDTIACMAAVILFFIPSVKRQGESVLTWDAAQAHLPWGVLILLGGGFAIAKGFRESMLTVFVGKKLAGAASMGRFPLTYVLTVAICLLTEAASNTATASIVLPILGSVATETLTHPLALMLPATVACSFAFMLPAATGPNAVVFATRRITIRDFIKAGVSINILTVLLCSPLIYLMGSAVYGTTGPFPRWACLEETCQWVNVPGIVNGQKVSSQACLLLETKVCRLHNGTVLDAVLNFSA